MNGQRSWAVPDNDTSRDLAPLLDYARNQYVSHTDWYLRHKESGISTLGAVLTAEVTVLGFYFSGNLHRAIALIGLLLLSSLAVPLTKLALLSCRKAFQASLEHVLLVTKVVWAMGWAETVAVAPYDPRDCPAHADANLYVERYLRDARGEGAEMGAVDTATFVKRNLKKRDSTYYATRIILILMGSAAGVVGLGGMIAVVLVKGKAG